MLILSSEIVTLTPGIMDHRVERRWPVNPRSAGTHVQAINKKLGVAAGKLESDEDPDFAFEKFSVTHYPLLPALGVAWEEFRASHYQEHELAWQPGELERDGLYGTPDGFLTTPDLNLRIWECKLTTKKVQPVDQCWLYMKQALCYCAMADIQQVQLDVCWVLGDYSRPYQPVLTVTVIEFERRECESWWRVVKKASERVGI